MQCLNIKNLAKFYEKWITSKFYSFFLFFILTNRTMTLLSWVQVSKWVKVCAEGRKYNPNHKSCFHESAFMQCRIYVWCGIKNIFLCRVMWKVELGFISWTFWPSDCLTYDKANCVGWLERSFMNRKGFMHNY